MSTSGEIQPVRRAVRYPIPMGPRLPPDPDPTTPHALWVEAQAAFPTDAEAASNHYAALLWQFGHLVPRTDGDDGHLPCGWPHFGSPEAAS